MHSVCHELDFVLSQTSQNGNAKHILIQNSRSQESLYQCVIVQQEKNGSDRLLGSRATERNA